MSAITASVALTGRGMMDTGLRMQVRLLFVDDEPAIRSAIAAFLSTRQYEVDLAEDLAGAASLLETRRYDGVITDLRLSGRNKTEGLEVISLARERLPQAKVILLTGYGSAPVEKEALARGADRCIQKPIPLGELDMLLRTLLLLPNASD